MVYESYTDFWLRNYGVILEWGEWDFATSRTSQVQFYVFEKKKYKTIKHKQTSFFLFGDAFMQLEKLARSQKHLFEVEMRTFFLFLHSKK